MLADLHARLMNDPATELKTAAAEQRKITRLRLREGAGMTLSTHVLDTSIGRPAKGMKVRLDYRQTSDSWTELGTFTTDADGRIQQLIGRGEPLDPAHTG